MEHWKYLSIYISIYLLSISGHFQLPAAALHVFVRVQRFDTRASAYVPLQRSPTVAEALHSDLEEKGARYTTLRYATMCYFIIPLSFSFPSAQAKEEEEGIAPLLQTYYLRLVVVGSKGCLLGIYLTYGRSIG
jgi:hypothetical protein